MSSKKTDTEGVIYGVIGFGYIISAIVFTIWVMDFERIHPKLIFWGHLVFIGVPTFVVGWIAESFEKNETQIENEIGNLIDFQGKIGRDEFWIPFLWINLITEISLLSIDVLAFGWEPDYPYSAFLSYSNLAAYFTIIPLLSLGAKRLHDTGRSGWWQLLILTVIGILVLIVFWAQESKADINKDGAIDPSKMTDELERLSQMFKDGIISEDEFSRAKSKLLD